MSHTLAASFNSQPDASRAVDALIAAGFAPERISMLVAEDARGQHFRVQQGNKAAEGAVGGGVLGGTLGALVAALAAIGIIATPGVGLVAAGPLLAALAGAGTGGVAGGLVGGLVGLGVPEHAAKVMEEQVSRGGILIAVDVPSTEERKLAEQVLEQTGATSTSRV
jgi:hypothetical protein